jgi:hemoglobin/transferrin/lactoferrin receptor protein
MDGFPPVIAKFNHVPVISPSSRSGIGIYLQDEIQIDEQLSVTTGLRYDWVKAETDGAPPPFFIDSPHSDTDAQLSGKLGMVYKIDASSNVYANIGRAFRAPTLIERYFFGPHDGPAQDRGNPELDPETSLNLDVGLRTENQRYQAGLSLYYNQVDDLIQKILVNPSEPVSQQVYQYQNISEATLYGGELDMRYFVDDTWNLFGSVTVSRGKDKRDNGALGGIPSHKATYGVQYETEWSNLYTNLELSAVSALRQNRIGMGERKTPGYTLLNFRAYLVYRDEISLSVGIENLLDRLYYDHLSYGWQQLGYAEQGRNVTFELNYRF